MPSDRFRTLDDPDPKPTPADAIAAGSLAADAINAGGIGVTAEWLVLGRLRIPVTRPAWWRRGLVWLVLGWRYDDL